MIIYAEDLVGLLLRGLQRLVRGLRPGQRGVQVVRQRFLDFTPVVGRQLGLRILQLVPGGEGLWKLRQVLEWNCALLWTNVRLPVEW